MTFLRPASLIVSALAACAAGAAFTAVPASATTAPPEHPHSVTVHDATHDVLRGPADSSRPPTTAAARRRQGDVTSMRVVHGEHRVRTTLHYAKLSRVSRSTMVHVFAFRAPSGVRADLAVLAKAGSWKGESFWDVDGKPRATCPGLRSRIDYGADTVRVSVPRNCLDDPRWVRVGGGGGAMVGKRLYADDANRDGRIGDDVALGARVYRR